MRTNMATTKQRRIRINRAEIQKAKQQILDNQSRTKKRQTPEHKREIRSWGADCWRGGIYCDPYGTAWGVDKSLKTVRLGRTDNILEATRDIDRDNPQEIIQATNHHRDAEHFHECHSDVDMALPIIGHGDIPIVATFKTDPHFVGLLERLISQEKGLRTIRSELKTNGYDIPLRTLGRWVKQRQPCLI